MSAPSVSVILPFRESASTLDRAIASIVGQTFSDWELVAIDNASSDDGRAIAERWARKDARIKVVDETEVGIAHALITGLEHTCGEYIARMDADDISHPERFARQLGYLENNLGIGILGTRTRFESSVLRSSGMRHYVEWQNGILTPHDHYIKRFVDAPLAHPSVMFRRHLVARHGGYDTGPLPEDHEMWLRWMDAGVRFAKLPEELLTWHDHATRLSRSHPNYSVDAFFTTKARWMARWMERVLRGRPVIIAGTSPLCQGRAHKLEAEGVRIDAFTDIRRREVPGYRFIPHDELPPTGQALIVSFISQRGTGDRIAAFLSSLGQEEGMDFILAA